MSTMDLHAAWARIGGGFTVDPSTRRVDLEDLVVRTLAAAPADARLFWVAASWLGVHHNLLNTRRLTDHLADRPALELAVAGAMLSVARKAAGPSTRLSSALKHCRALAEPRPLFDVNAAHPVLAWKVRDGALPLFLRWGLWQDDVSLRTDAVRPVAWVLANCPEFRARSLFGANLESEILDLLMVLPSTVSDLSEVLGTTYAATHEAAGRLIGRGWLRKRREAQRQVLTVREGFRAWFEAFPVAFPERMVTVA